MLLSKTGVGIALALVCLVILGVMPILSNSRPEDFGALEFAFLLSVWQLIFAAPLTLWEARRARAAGGARTETAPSADRAARRQGLLVALLTGAMFGLSTYLYVFGIEKAGAISAAIAIQAYPLFAILWETLFLNRRKTRIELALTGVLMIALYFLGTGGTWRIEGLSPWFLVALSVPFLWSVAHVIIKEQLARTPITPIQIVFVRVAISAFFLGGVLVFAAPGALPDLLFRPDFQAAAALMGFVYYAELVIWFYAVRTIDVSLASSITTPWPALTMVLAAMFLGETVALYQIIAFLVVAASIYGLMVAGIRKEKTAAV